MIIFWRFVVEKMVIELKYALRQPAPSIMCPKIPG